ncbi:hypothetical protein HOO65_040054 [Ceratocystis lukuohia]|uniref:Uncharacterized protein n=1 Tax=Ceratocystis lukuohia TaxID=2019550 RepID=A0ABR4MHI1_9PEZI
MKPSSFLPFGLSFSYFGHSNPDSTSAAEPTWTAGIDSTESLEALSTDPADAYYLSGHGYSSWVEKDGSISVHSDRAQDQSEMLRVRFDTDHKVTKIYENNLRDEKAHRKNLDLHQIFQALCYEHDIDFNEIGWIHMDVHDDYFASVVRNYRKANGLSPKQEIRVTVNDKGWDTFANDYYSIEAAKMVPDAIMDKIIIRREERPSSGTSYPAVVAEVMRFSFKELWDEESNISGPSIESDSELESEF